MMLVGSFVTVGWLGKPDRALVQQGLGQILCGKDAHDCFSRLELKAKDNNMNSTHGCPCS